VRKPALALALVHHPVVDAGGALTTTAVTNLDVHDLARSARTYGCSDLFIVHPVDAQRELVERIREHWLHGSSGRRIPDRKDAVELVRVVRTLDDAIAALGGRDSVEIWVTAARDVAPPVTFPEAKLRLASTAKNVLLVFGTGWGLAAEVVTSADVVLAPIRAAVPPELNAGYNHLSVRAACAIALDRLRG
jgi:hypothetical protein